MPTLQHTHSYIYWKEQGNPSEHWYKCADPHCTHVAPRSLILDKASLCPKCFQKELILDRLALLRKRPLCIDCRNTKEAQLHKRAKELLEGLLSTPTETAEQLEQAREVKEEIESMFDVEVEEVKDNGQQPK